MSSAKTLKVKDLAGKYGLSPKDVIRELNEQGFDDVKSASSAIPADAVEIVELYFEDYIAKRKAGAKGKGKTSAAAPVSTATIAPPVVVKALAEALGKKPNEVVSGLMQMNVLASINQTVPPEVAIEYAKKCGIELTVGAKEKETRQETAEDTEHPEDFEYEDNPKDIVPRCPIVTFMGHVDHGKTSLQDRIRKTDIAGGEAGGITQHIGASVVNLNGKTITFVDTPGHEAFTAMRARGANVTDVVVLVVAADDGFMPQTAIRVSAKSGMGIQDLLERILLEAEMLELKANPKRPGMAYVLESQLEQGFGPTANIVVKNGTIKIGDPILCGEFWGKVKNLTDYRGQRIKSAGPGTPVKIAGLSGVPEAGTKLVVCSSEHHAKELAEARAEKKREEQLLHNSSAGASLEDLFSKMESDKKQSLCVVLKADVNGSCEAIAESFKKLPSDKITINVVHSGVGAITENDVLLAASSHGIVVGFHVRVNPGVNTLAKKENVEIRLYSIIYELIEDITDALTGRLEPEKRERELGVAKILQIFELSKGPKVCGCIVEKGSVKVGSKARVFRHGELIFNGEVRSLRRFQDDVREVKQGLECGIKLDNFADFDVNDIIQVYDIELKKASL